MATINFSPVASLVPFFLSEKFISLVCGPVGCVAGNTEILTARGPVPIQDIVEPTQVLSWDATIGRFRLSWCGGAYPKGTDYLYRVVTPKGEFVAAGPHRMLCADGEYRQVDQLRVGDFVTGCLQDLRPTTGEFFPAGSLADDLHCSEIDVGYLGCYAALARRGGPHALAVAEAAQEFVRGHSGAQKSTAMRGLDDFSRLRSPLVELPVHTPPALLGDQTRIGDSAPRPGLLPAAGLGRIGSDTCGYYEDSRPEALQFQRTNACRSPMPEFAATVENFDAPLSTPSYTITDCPILQVTRLPVQETFWDLQVWGTNNYVTVDGTVHHNSTKTSSGIVKILYHAKKMAPCKDGIRRSRCIWVRNTREQLRDTSIPDFLKWFPDGLAGSYAKADGKFFLKLDDVECEVLFRGLDDSNDVRRVLSLQASFAVFDEFREINKDVFEAIQARLGRYPDGVMVPHKPQWGVDEKGNPRMGCVMEDGTPNSHVWGMSNPPDMDTYWEKLLTDPEDNMHVTIQPSGMSPEADWIHLLPSGYYETLAKGKSQDYIDVYLHAKFGKSLAGQPVFRAFDMDYHVADAPLRPILNGWRPLLIGMDFGLNPSAVLGQLDAMGRLLIFRALTADGMGLLRFLRTILKPELANSFPGAPVLVIGDPAGRARVQTDERTVYDILREEGLNAIEASTNSIIARISAVDKYLQRQVDTGPGFLVDPEGCRPLVQALRGKYRYKLKTNGELEDTPEKNEASHISDALQYLALHADAQAGAALMGQRREVEQQSMAAWT